MNNQSDNIAGLYFDVQIIKSGIEMMLNSLCNEAGTYDPQDVYNCIDMYSQKIEIAYERCEFLEDIECIENFIIQVEAHLNDILSFFNVLSEVYTFNRKVYKQKDLINIFGVLLKISTNALFWAKKAKNYFDNCSNLDSIYNNS